MAEERTESVRETLEAAFNAAEKAAPPPPRAESRPIPKRDSPITNELHAPRDNRADIAPQRSEPEERPEPDQTEGDSEDAERGVDRPRDQFGRFARSSPEGKPPEQTSAPAEPPQATETPDQPEQREAEPEGPALLPPNAWSAPAKESWGQLPRAIQEEVDRRERDFQRHFQERAQQVTVLEPLAQAIQPYQQKLALRGINPAAAIGQLLAVQDLLETDPIQGVAHVARVYGVDLRSFATAFQQAQQPQDPALRELSDRVARQDQMLAQWQRGAEQQAEARITAEVQQFASNTRDYPYFEQVRERMAQLMSSGAVNSLAQAYRLACADNDDIGRLIQQQREQAQRQQRSFAERQAADRAKRAAVSVSGTPYGGVSVRSQPPRNESVRDTVLRSFEEVASR